jgi:hypothetical protein
MQRSERLRRGFLLPQADGMKRTKSDLVGSVESLDRLRRWVDIIAVGVNKQ